MIKMFYVLALAVFFLLSPQSEANSTDNVPTNIAKPSSSLNFDEEALKKTLSHTLGLNVSSARKTPMTGLAEVITDQGLFYTSYDGKFFIQGKLFGIGTANVTNLTESSLAQVRIDGMTRFANDMIIYPAKNEKHVITVFTDITCGYCRKMHERIDEYNDKGITVRYLAYPRSGVKDRAGGFTQGYQDLVSVWCNENPNKALTSAKLGSRVAQRICDKPIAEEFYFGSQIGVTGTPAIILDNGFLLSGYREPNDLAEILESM